MIELVHSRFPSCAGFACGFVHFGDVYVLVIGVEAHNAACMWSNGSNNTMQ